MLTCQSKKSKVKSQKGGEKKQEGKSKKGAES